MKKLFLLMLLLSSSLCFAESTFTLTCDLREMPLKDIEEMTGFWYGRMLHHKLEKTTKEEFGLKKSYISFFSLNKYLSERDIKNICICELFKLIHKSKTGDRCIVNIRYKNDELAELKYEESQFSYKSGNRYFSNIDINKFYESNQNAY